MKADGNGSQREKKEWIFNPAMTELEDIDDHAGNGSRSQQNIGSPRNQNTGSSSPEILYSCKKKIDKFKA